MLTVIDGAVLPGDARGQKAGWRKPNADDKDAAIAQAVEYIASGMTVRLAASKVNADFKLNLTNAYVKRLIGAARRN